MPHHPSRAVPGSTWSFGRSLLHSFSETAVSVADVPDEKLEPAVRTTITETVSSYGWKVLFDDEPDGRVRGYLVDGDSDEVLKTEVGSDFHDAWLSLAIGTYPPSQELRQHRGS